MPPEILPQTSKGVHCTILQGCSQCIRIQGALSTSAPRVPVGRGSSHQTQMNKLAGLKCFVPSTDRELRNSATRTHGRWLGLGYSLLSPRVTSAHNPISNLKTMCCPVAQESQFRPRENNRRPVDESRPEQRSPVFNLVYPGRFPQPLNTRSLTQPVHIRMLPGPRVPFDYSSPSIQCFIAIDRIDNVVEFEQWTETLVGGWVNKSSCMT